MKLTGNTILITGGSTGIGLAFAKKFVELDNTVIITGRSQNKLDKARQAEPKLHAIQCDAGDPVAISKLGETMRAQFPTLNVLINNAGIFQFKNLGVPSDDLRSFTEEMEVNVAGPIRTIATLIEQLQANQGTIINVSSGLAFVPLSSAPVYSASKAALHAYTICLRFQLAEQGVKVIELMPPVVQTEMSTDVQNAKGIKVMKLPELLDDSLRLLQKGKSEIRPGQSKQLHWMSRIAPGFIRGELAKSTKGIFLDVSPSTSGKS